MDWAWPNTNLRSKLNWASRLNTFRNMQDVPKTRFQNGLNESTCTFNRGNVTIDDFFIVGVWNFSSITRQTTFLRICKIMQKIVLKWCKNLLAFLVISCQQLWAIPLITTKALQVRKKKLKPSVSEPWMYPGQFQWDELFDLNVDRHLKEILLFQPGGSVWNHPNGWYWSFVTSNKFWWSSLSV